MGASAGEDDGGVGQAEAAQGHPGPVVPGEQEGAEPEVDAVAEIERLGALKDKGLLSDEEFAAAKAKLLGGP